MRFGARPHSRVGAVDVASPGQDHRHRQFHNEETEKLRTEMTKKPSVVRTCGQIDFKMMFLAARDLPE
jgi:hypothetical protein